MGIRPNIRCYYSAEYSAEYYSPKFHGIRYFTEYSVIYRMFWYPTEYSGIPVKDSGIPVKDFMHSMVRGQHAHAGI